MPCYIYIFIIFPRSTCVNFPFQPLNSVLSNKNVIVETGITALLFTKGPFIVQTALTAELIGLHFPLSKVNTVWRKLQLRIMLMNNEDRSSKTLLQSTLKRGLLLKFIFQNETT